MRGTRIRSARLFALLALALGAEGLATAQEEVGALHGTVRDTDGGVLQGATVELEGMGAPRLQVADDRGAFRFLRLDPGLYRLRTSLDGFSTVEHPEIEVRLAQSTSLEVELPVEKMGEVITVVGESPLLDSRNISTGVTISSQDLDTLPVTHTVWGQALQVPGVLTDQVNVGGSEGGYTSVFRAPGSSYRDNTYLMDGVDIGDMVVVGAAGSHLDVHQFSEIQFRVSGADVTKATAGVSINLVTKRGSNEFRGSARFYRTDDRFFGWQSSNSPVRVQPDSDLAPTQPSFVGNTLDQVDNYGLEAGGSAVRDRLWFWGTFGTHDYKLRTGGTSVEDVQDQDSVFEFAALKVNWQIVQANSFVGSWNYGEHKRFGFGAGVTRPRETTWDQRGPVDLFKFEDFHVVSSSLFLSGAYSRVKSGFAVVSKACVAAGDCESAPETLWDADGVWRRSYLGGLAERPSDQIKLEGSYFFNTGKSAHEIKFGGRLRDFEASSSFTWPGRNLFIIDLDLFGEEGDIEQVVGQGGTDTPPTSLRYTSLWVQDTISLGRWTINAGLRYDFQQGRSEATISQGNDTFPVVLPDIEYEGGDAPFDWSTIVPRLGVTYALGEERNTLLRASFSQFAQQLGSGSIEHLNPAGLRYAYYYFTDANENLYYDEGEDLEFGFCWGCPPDYVSAATANRTDPDFGPEITTEGLLEVQHSFLPELVVSASYTYRDRRDVTWERPLVDEDGSVRSSVAADWQLDDTEPARLPDGTVTGVEVYALGPTVSYTGGDLLTNSERSVIYNGVNVSVTKRLSNQWMMRGFLQYSRGRWRVPDNFVTQENPNPDEYAYDVDGAVFGERSLSGRSSNVFIENAWSWNLNGMYQFAPNRPYGFNIAANLYGREGFPIPYYQAHNFGDGLGRQNVSVLDGDLDRFRADDIFTTDLRLEKEFATSSNLGFTFAVDIFNIFNSSSVMQRERLENGDVYDWLDQTLAPRVWRLGVRINWR